MMGWLRERYKARLLKEHEALTDELFHLAGELARNDDAAARMGFIEVLRAAEGEETIIETIKAMRLKVLLGAPLAPDEATAALALRRTFLGMIEGAELNWGANL